LAIVAEKISELVKIEF